MTKHNNERVKVRNFTVAFEQMCNFVAITKTSDYNEAVRRLILQCFVILPNDHFYNAKQIMDAIDTLFGLQIPEHQIQAGIDFLKKEQIIQQPANTNYTPSSEIRNNIQSQIDEATALEEKVKHGWLAELLNSAPDLSAEKAWKALKGYLARAFRRHGIQAAALLDPTIDIAPEYSESLSFLLNEVIKDCFSNEQFQIAKKVISDFLSSVGNHPDRAAYIGQLADGAFNYFALTVAPDVAKQFLERLNPLTLFLDTNFLFGILDLHVHPQVAVSNELLNAIQKHKLPIKLRYHQATEKEMFSTISHYSSILHARVWSQTISRAALTSNYLSGIELKYHRLNAKTGIDVESFLKPYEHVDVLLKDKEISIHRKEENRVYEESDLFHEYKEFLESKGNPKPYDALAHDIKLLDTARQLRAKSQSTLGAGALLITCDYFLYRFDWENSRKSSTLACTVLPNIFWQIIRPYIPSDVDFDRSFAETFAIPEFRTIGSGASKACSKLLSMLAAYKDIPEGTAARLLSNDLLIDRLRNAENDEQFHEYVESAIVTENALLMEEKAALAKQVESERAEKEEKEKKLEEEQKAYEQEKIKAEQALKQKDANFKSLEELKNKEKERAELAIKEAEKRAHKEILGREMAEKKANIYEIITASSVSIVLIGIFEFLVYYKRWGWLINHSNSYGLQGAFDLFVALLVFGLFNRKWRKWCWVGGIFPVILIIIQLLGGLTKQK